ncbi:hypothetical protein BOX15_Mlig004567g1, partial [Macrostomum lignano]
AKKSVNDTSEAISGDHSGAAGAQVFSAGGFFVESCISTNLFVNHFDTRTCKLKPSWLDQVIYPLLRQHGEYCQFSVNKVRLRAFKRHRKDCSFLWMRLVCAEGSGCSMAFVVTLNKAPTDGQSSTLTLRRISEHSGHDVPSSCSSYRYLLQRGSQECRNFVLSQATNPAAKPTQIYVKAIELFGSEACSLSAVRTTVSRTKAADDKSPDDIRDLRLQMKDWKLTINEDGVISGYIQKIDVAPVSVILHTSMQLDLLRDVLKGNQLAPLHLDATGGIVRQTQNVPSTVLLCSAVVATPDIKRTAVSESIMEVTRSENVSSWLMHFLADFARHCNIGLWELPKKGPQIYVSDFSWVFIHGILRAACTTCVTDYLRVQYNRLRSADLKPPESPVVFICSSHLLRAVARTLKSPDKIDKVTYREFMLSFALLVTSKTLRCAQAVWKAMVEVFTSRRVNPATLKALQILHGRFDFSSLEIPDENQVAEDSANVSNAVQEDVALAELETGLRASSPFAKYFNDLTSEVTASDGNGVLNNLFYPQAVQVVLRKWMPLFPLWSVAVFGGNRSAHVTNAAVESWFSWCKSEALPSPSSRLRLPRFVRAQLTTVKLQLKRLQHEQHPIRPPKRARGRKCGFDAPLNPPGDPWKRSGASKRRRTSFIQSALSIPPAVAPTTCTLAAPAASGSRLGSQPVIVQVRPAIAPTTCTLAAPAASGSRSGISPAPTAQNTTCHSLPDEQIDAPTLQCHFLHYRHGRQRGYRIRRARIVLSMPPVNAWLQH